MPNLESIMLCTDFEINIPFFSADEQGNVSSGRRSKKSSHLKILMLNDFAAFVLTLGPSSCFVFLRWEGTYVGPYLNLRVMIGIKGPLS